MSIPAFFPAGLRRVAWRTLRNHFWQNLLVIVGITLGVAVVVSIDLANASAQQAFELSTQTITGKATHQIYGSTGPLDESVYVDLVRHGLAVQAAPVVSEYVSASGLGGRTFQLLGIDPFVDATFRSYLGSQDMPDLAPLVALLTRPGAVLLSAELADGYGLQPGQEFDIEMAGRTQTVFVAGLLHPADRLSQWALDGLILADIATAQELRDSIGLAGADAWIDRGIEMIRRDHIKEDLRCVMETVAPDGAVIDHFDGRTLNPGHAIEAAWFILAEAEHRGGISLPMSCAGVCGHRFSSDNAYYVGRSWHHRFSSGTGNQETVSVE